MISFQRGCMIFLSIKKEKIFFSTNNFWSFYRLVLSSFLSICVERLRDFFLRLFDFFCWQVTWFFLRRGCLIFLFVESLRDFFVEVVWFFLWSGCVIFLWRLCVFLCGKVALNFWRGYVIFIVERLHDFFCGEVAWFFCERLHDFCVERLRCFLTHSLTKVALFIFVKVAWFFLLRGWMIF